MKHSRLDSRYDGLCRDGRVLYDRGVVSGSSSPVRSIAELFSADGLNGTRVRWYVVVERRVGAY